MLPVEGLQSLPPGAVLTALVAPVSYALAGRVAGHLIGKGMNGLMLACCQLICSTLMVALVLPAPPASLPGLEVGLAMLGLALPSTAFAYLLFFRLIASAGPTNAMLVTMLVPVSATLIAALWIGEVLTLTKAVAMITVIAGLALVDGRVLRLFKTGG
ncbi:MAG: hypothetical protein Alpg2KO_25810 [Alphaproteobacteria bacterium]